MAIAQRHTATKPNATGILAPLVRAATHIGYLVGIAESVGDDGWEAKREEAKTEMVDILEHMAVGLTPNHKAFVGNEVALLYVAIKGDIEAARDAIPGNRPDALRMFQVLNANTAYVAAAYERAMTGEDVDEGTNP
jgi:hypothetical protein